MVFNAAFGTNTNKSDHFEVILFSRAEHLPGVLNQETWIDTPYNIEEKHGLWTQIDLVPTSALPLTTHGSQMSYSIFQNSSPCFQNDAVSPALALSLPCKELLAMN